MERRSSKIMESVCHIHRPQQLLSVWCAGSTLLFQVQLEARLRKKQADSSLPCHHLVFNSILVKESIVVPKKSEHLLCGSVHVLSPIRLFMSLWTVAHQAPLSMGFPRQKYWSGLPFPSPGHLLDPGIECESHASPALKGGFFTTEPSGNLCSHILLNLLSTEGFRDILSMCLLDLGIHAKKEQFLLRNEYKNFMLGRG